MAVAARRPRSRSYAQAQRQSAGVSVANWPIAVFAAAIGVRLALIPLISHTWDTHTWWNVFADLDMAKDPLAAIRAPYYQMETLSTMARSEQRGLFYEYWAYPPGMLYIFYPLAKLYGLLGELNHQFGAAYSFTVIQIPDSFMLMYKLPAFAADMVIGGLLWRMVGSKGATWFLFNPYVLLISNWTFESVMVASVIGAIYLQERDRTVGAAAALAFGTAVKFIPLFLAPAFVLYLFNKRNGSIREPLIFCVAFGAALLVFCGPALDLISVVVGFQSDRAGGGLTFYMAAHALSANDILLSPSPSLLFILGQIGSFILPLGMLLGIVYLYTKPHMSLSQLCLAMAFVYLASTKLVNEAYLLVVVVLLTIETIRQASPVLERLRTVMWALPFAWAMINVPWQGFFAYFLVQNDHVTPADFQAWADIHYLDSNTLLGVLAVMGILASLLYLWAIPVVARQGEPREN